ncbi:MAG: hypothetical protein L6Q81_09690 [Bacteroidia bacterium]|nr:hypothetical protein [Bacteroidia bacterium]
MKQRSAYILLAFLFCSFVAQKIQPDFSLKMKSDQMLTDNLSNVYLIQNDQIRKYNPKLELMKEFSNKNFGAITSADVTNPLRVVLFYRDFGRVIFLDNTLSQNGEPLAMEKLGFPLASLVGSSHDNGFWVYDQPTFEMVRFDQNLSITSRSGNLSQILGIELQPDFILEKDNRLFLNNPQTGIMVFDVFGTYIKTIPLKGLHTFQVADESIIYFQNGELQAWNLITNETTLYEEPKRPEARNIRLEKESVVVMDSSGVDLYIRKK